jgi:type IV secretory pathway TraG/TraD family ATPase VirD4
MNDRLATARWEDPAEVSRKYSYSFRNFWLGRAHDGSPLGYLDDRHICLVSGNRGGKGSSVIINNLCYWPGSAVVIDPKGENATVTAARRGQGDGYCAGLGQAVHVLDPFGAAKAVERYRSCFNPLDALDPAAEDTIDEAARLANAIVVVNDTKSETYFDEAARGMVKALILHVVTSPDFAAEERNLPMIRDLLKRGDWQVAELMRSQAAAEGRSFDEADNDPQLLLWRSVENNPAFGGVLAGDGAHNRGLLVNTPKTYYSALQTALINTEFLDSPPMRRMLLQSDFRLGDLKTAARGMTLYLSLPQRYMATHYRWLRMMVALTTTEMEKVPGVPVTGRPVLMILDEFAGLKRMEAIESAVAQIAGFGVKLFFVLQSLEQLKATYKDAWETFLANAGLKLFFSIDDNFTRDYVSKQIGETEIVRYMQSENAGSSETDSEAAGRTHSTGTTESQGQTRSVGETQTTGTTRSTGQTYSQGTTHSTARGSTLSETFGTSETFNQGWNRSESVSSSEGKNWSTSQSRTTGSSDTTSYSRGSNSSFSWGPGGATSSGGSSSSHGSSTSTSESDTFGTSSGGSSSLTKGTSKGTSGGVAKGTSRSTADGKSLTDTTGTSDTAGQSLTTGDSQSKGHSTTTGDSSTKGISTTSGDSETITRGTGRTKGTGLAETIHRRPLLRPEEIGQLFARLEKTDALYPGMALVLVGGGHPLMVRRVHYFEDAQFIDCFSPHPDHGFVSAFETRIEGLLPLISELEAAMEGRRVQIAEWLTQPQRLVTGGQQVARIDDVPRRGNQLYLYAPCDGKALKFGETGEMAASGAAVVDPLLSVKYYDGNEGNRFDPLQDLRAACKRLRKPKPVLPAPVQAPLVVPSYGAPAETASSYAEPYRSSANSGDELRELMVFVGLVLVALVVIGLVIWGLVLWHARAHVVHQHY